MTQSVESSVTAVTGVAAPRTVEHDIPLYLASDEALIHILDRYPEDLLEIHSSDLDADGQGSLGDATRARPDGRTILAAIKAGRLSVSLRSCERAHPGLWAEAQRAFQNLSPQLGAATKGSSRARKMTGQLILSSPAARVPFRFDAAGVVVFHLRGVKRVWVYPGTEDFLPQAAMENVIAGAATEPLAHQRIMDGAAWRFDIVPGEALTWPLYAPHRVENQEGLCVSLSMTYETWPSRITTGAHRANAVLRRWNHTIKPMAQTGWAHRTMLWALSLVFVALNLVKANVKLADLTFNAAKANNVADVSVPMHEAKEAA